MFFVGISINHIHKEYIWIDVNIYFNAFNSSALLCSGFGLRQPQAHNQALRTSAMRTICKMKMKKPCMELKTQNGMAK